ncbi:MAG: hypothetical protein NC432_15065 [Roseburia sp.]|nr:hypothetical protein [Roseburia sp.]MCM1097237.1 hypothetical protein [Ruminococcus flavefaciens]
MEQIPEWMSDPLVKEIPEKKLRFLGEMFTSGQGKSQKELMNFLMPMLKKARQENLTFTPQEMNAAIAAIKKHSSQSELEQIDKILEKTQKK